MHSIRKYVKTDKAGTVARRRKKMERMFSVNIAVDPVPNRDLVHKVKISGRRIDCSNASLYIDSLVNTENIEKAKVHLTALFFNEEVIENVERQSNAVIEELRPNVYEVKGHDRHVTVALDLLEEILKENTPSKISNTVARRLSATMRNSILNSDREVNNNCLHASEKVKRAIIGCLNNCNEDSDITDKERNAVEDKEDESIEVILISDEEDDVDDAFSQEDDESNVDKDDMDVSVMIIDTPEAQKKEVVVINLDTPGTPERDATSNEKPVDGLVIRVLSHDFREMRAQIDIDISDKNNKGSRLEMVQKRKARNYRSNLGDKEKLEIPTNCSNDKLTTNRHTTKKRKQEYTQENDTGNGEINTSDKEHHEDVNKNENKRRKVGTDTQQNDTVNAKKTYKPLMMRSDLDMNWRQNNTESTETSEKANNKNVRVPQVTRGECSRNWRNADKENEALIPEITNKHASPIKIKQTVSRAVEKHTPQRRESGNVAGQRPTGVYVPPMMRKGYDRKRRKDEMNRLQQSQKKQYIVIDGNNVAMAHGKAIVFSCKGLRLSVDFFKKRGHSLITVFLPMWRKCRPRDPASVTGRYILDDLEAEGHLVYTPSRRIGNKLVASYDDRFILELADRENGIIVSNDDYRDLINEKASWKNIIDERLLRFTFVQDNFMVPDFPVSSHEPTPIGLRDQPCQEGAYNSFKNTFKNLNSLYPDNVFVRQSNYAH